ncbi:hypothetical protein BJX61DRAFT_78033 [Aspergillus egyptiacus]|nr:hypothetical protein BJX61DRAFT_78033 [Aspergillus egyptiacus]
MSLNSLISWLSTIFRACIIVSTSEALGQLKWVWFAQEQARPVHELRVYDSASRGLYGAMELIWALRARHFAVLGSLAVILAVAVDPFAQNLVYYYQDMVDDASQRALLGRSTYYDVVGTGDPLMNPQVDSILKANVYNSLLNNDPQKPWSIPQYSCPSGNCTWDPIVSLEARALCANVTNFLSLSCGPTPVPNGQRDTATCTFSLPGNRTQVSLEFFYINETAIEDVAVESTLFASSGLGINGGLVYTNRSLGVIQFVAREIPSKGILSHSPLPGTGVEATECAIVPVVQSFRASVQNNVYTDSTLATWAFSTTNDGDHILQPPWGHELRMDSSQTFSINFLSGMQINNFIDEIFTGYYWRGIIHRAYEVGVPYPSYAVRDILQALAEGDVVGCGDDLPSRLNCTMKNVAQAVTKTFRDSAYSLNTENNTGVAVGRAHISVTHIAVRWEWIMLLILVWTLGVLLLVGTLWKVRRGRVPRWKNDPLPLLFLYSEPLHERPGAAGLPVQGSLGNRDQMMLRLYESDGRIMLG